MMHFGSDCDSAFESDHDSGRCRNRKRQIDSSKPFLHPPEKISKQSFTEECTREEDRKQKFHLLSLDAYSRHKKLINEYILCHPGATSYLRRDTTQDRTDQDIIKEHHCFLWSEEDSVDNWEKRLARKYYDKLFKEYCLCDLTRYKENKLALRWRTELEVVDGKGQFVCGEKGCKVMENLRSWEVNFGYLEHGEKKNALVKLRLCPDCSYKLNYHFQRKEVKRLNAQAENKSTLLKKLKVGRGLDQLAVDPDQTKEFAGEGMQAALDDGTRVWSEQANITEKTQEEEFEDYLADMLL